MNPFFAKYLTPSEIKLVQNLALRLYCHVDHISYVIYYESRFKTKAINLIGSVGLIQFTPDNKNENFKVINGNLYLLKDIYNMTFDEQIELTFQYYKPYIGKLDTLLNVYLAVFFPYFIGKDLHSIMQTKHLSSKLIAKQNPSFDTNKNGQITLSEFDIFINKQFSTLIKKKK